VSPAPARLSPAAIAGLALLTAAALLRGGCVRAETVNDASATLAWDSNVTRANVREDVRADARVDARLAGGWRFDLAEYGSAELGAGLAGAQYGRFTRLSSAAVDASASWHRKLGLGLAAPWLSAGVGLAHEDYRDDTRDSDRLEAHFEAGKRWTEAIETSAGYAYDRRRAHQRAELVPGISGAVWDVRGHTVFARAAWALDERWQLSGELAGRRGDVVATTRRHRDIFLAADAIARSTSFGDGFFDYRLRGTTGTATSALSYALDAHSSLNLGYAFALTRAAHDLDYRNHLVSATWLFRP